MFTKHSSILDTIKDNVFSDSLANFIDRHRLGTALVACTSAVALYGIWFLKRPQNLPPGPYGYPFIGSSHFVTPLPGESLSQLAKHYGELFTLWMGGNRYLVVLNNYEAIKDAYISHGSAFMDRHAEDMTETLQLEDTIITKHNDAAYKESRKIVSQALRSLINSRLENILSFELDEVERFLDGHLGEPIDLAQSMQRVVTNTITQIMFNRRYNDEESERLYTLFTSWFYGFTVTFASAMLPQHILKWIHAKSIIEAKKETANMISFIETHQKEHKESIKDGEIKDVMDAYIVNSDAMMYTDRQIAATILTFMPDASFSTFDMTMWVLLYLTNHPDTQEEIYREIQEVTGSRIEGLHLRAKMPITESFIMEVFRIVTPFPFGVPNKPVESTVFRGYNIFHFCTVIPNYGAVHQDPKLFPEPEKFKPRRFIKDGKIGNKEGFMPFGIGRRMCIGEQLVRNEIFYIVTRLVLRYRLKSIDGTKVNPEYEGDALKFLKTFQLFFERR